MGLLIKIIDQFGSYLQPIVNEKIERKIEIKRDTIES